MTQYEDTIVDNRIYNITFQVIVTLEDGDQFPIDIPSIPNLGLTEEKLISIVLSALDIEELENLSKLSFCQIIEDEEVELFEPFRENMGKYYFNVDVNTDHDTRYWSNFRDDFIKNKLK
jgi:hypothetical protein